MEFDSSRDPGSLTWTEILGLPYTWTEMKKLWSFRSELEAAYLWLLACQGSFSYVLISAGVSCLSLDFQDEHSCFLSFSCGAAMNLHLLALCYVLAFCRHVRRPLIGRFRRGAVDAITVGSALILRQFVKMNVIVELVLITLHFHSLAQLLHAAEDIGWLDLLLGWFMQVMVYVTSEEKMYVTNDVVFCGFVILFRYWSYSPPTKPVTLSKKVDDVMLGFV